MIYFVNIIDNINFHIRNYILLCGENVKYFAFCILHFAFCIYKLLNRVLQLRECTCVQSTDLATL